MINATINMTDGRGNNENFLARKRAVNYTTSRKPPTTNPRITHDEVSQPVRAFSDLYIYIYLHIYTCAQLDHITPAAHVRGVIITVFYNRTYLMFEQIRE